MGARIKLFRKNKGITQKQLAENLGISLSYMSQLESAKSNISVSMLLNIVRILNLPSVALLLDEKPMGGVAIIRTGDRKNYVGNEGKVTTDILYASSNRQLDVFVMRLPVDADTKKADSHRGNEFCFVIRGKVRLFLGDHHEYELGKNDVAAYPAENPHRWVNIGEEDAEVLVASTPGSI